MNDKEKRQIARDVCEGFVRQMIYICEPEHTKKKDFVHIILPFYFELS